MGTAKTIYYNGTIYTLREEGETVEAVLTEGNSIICAGTLAEVKKAGGSDAKYIDLNGKTMLPGLIDAHAHPIMGAFFLSGVVMKVDMDLDALKETIKAYIDEHPDKGYYFGQGYPEWIFDSKGPRKEVLDEICRDKPVVLLGSSGHEGWCNSKALELAQVDKNFRDPIPGFHYFERDEEGNPTGHFSEMGCLNHLCNKIKLFDEDEIRAKIKDILEFYGTMGVTAIADCGSTIFMEDIGFPLVTKLAESGELNQRIFGCCFVAQSNEVDGAVEHLKDINEKYFVKDLFELNTLKIINDGTMETRTASLTVPYPEDGSMVEPMLQGEKLYSLCLKAAEEGFDIYIHAIGDKAIHETIMTAKVIREAGLTENRITNAHTEYVLEEDLPLFAKYNVIANTTGSWHYGNEDMDKILGKIGDHLFPMGTILKHGAIMSLGSDFPVDEVGPEPMLAVEVGVTRQLPGDPDSIVLRPESERLTVHQMICGYTKDAAYQLRMEDKIGTIEAGKYADMVVVDKDPYKTEIYKVHEIKPVMTIMNGKTVFEA